ncbi:MAG: prephenate dehydrogenase [Dehalococcoidia bacterium]|nr:prephenate dehydrogenase [Dehalococcoidia bacterium]
MSLENLRGAIDDVDARIVKLLAERLLIAGQIGLEKRLGGIPLNDAAREATVLERVRRLAEAEGVSAAAVENVYRHIITSSKSVQDVSTALQGETGTQVGAASYVIPEGDWRIPERRLGHSRTTKRFAIVGGAGRMGRWLGKLLLAEQMDVILIGRDAGRLSVASSELKTVATTDLRAAGSADVIILSVPINGFASLVEELGQYVKPGQTVIDLTSVKVMPVDMMHKHLPNCLTLGAHPVFGPGAESLSGHNVILTPTNDPEQALAQWAQTWLETHGARVRLMSPTEHDRLMSVVLGLAHFIAIVSGDVILNQEDHAGLEMASGVTFRALRALVASVLGEDPELYAAIQTNLPDLPVLERSFIEKAAEWADLVAAGNAIEFARRMRALDDRLERGESRAAYNALYRITEK